MNRNKFIVGLLVWFIGLPLSISISYILRKTGDFNSLGMPEIAWFIMHIAIYVSSISLIYFSLQKFNLSKKIASIVILSLVYAVYYFGATWFYIIESGIDSV